MKNHLTTLLVFFIHLTGIQCINAQINIEQIKSDPNYWSAEGHGTTIEEADHDALSQIARNISVNIVSDIQETDQSGLKADGTEYSSYAAEGNIQSFSFASLTNVEMIVLQPEPDAKVFRWVAKSEVEKIFAERANKILDFVETGKEAEKRLQIDDALRNYYWALVLSRSNNKAVYAEFNGEQQNCLTFLPLKIKSVISHIKANLVECTSKDNRHYAIVRFTYDDKEVASLQLRYFDGQSYQGPLMAKDGIGELDLLSLPVNKKLKIRYEYSFQKEAENLDVDLRAAFSAGKLPIINNALVEIPVKIDRKGTTMEPNRKYENGVSTIGTPPETASIKAETSFLPQRKELEAVTDPADYLVALHAVESAINNGSPQSAYPHFTPDGYKLFEKLLTKTGKVSLIGKEQNYNFVRANGQVLGRFCKIKIKFKNGKSFMENLTFRFNDEKKIQSLAFALTQKAEADIFNAASSWTDISRFTILQFMEDYQTAYALKRIDYLEKVFSDDAIIITGSVLKTASPQTVEGMPVSFKTEEIRYTRQTKQQYLANLRRHFKEREYIHLTFEDNITKVINAPRIPKGTAFAIQINQLYSSPVYSDKGYLTLVLDASKELPIIHVRLWQPDKKDMMSLEEFMNKFEF